jgi:hypothetical protein
MYHKYQYTLVRHVGCYDFQDETYRTPIARIS